MITDEEFAYDMLLMAYREAATFSDDTSTTLGAVVASGRRILGIGVNRFPTGLHVTEERLTRPLKYAYMEHAERNAIFDAMCQGHSCLNATMYCPWFACTDCARAIIEIGIGHVIGHKQLFEIGKEHPRFAESVNLGLDMLGEAGIETDFLDCKFEETEILFDGKKWAA